MQQGREEWFSVLDRGLGLLYEGALAPCRNSVTFVKQILIRPGIAGIMGETLACQANLVNGNPMSA